MRRGAKVSPGEPAGEGLRRRCVSTCPLKLVAEGAVPLIDFEHGWNAGGWYVGAALYELVGGRPAMWVFAWSVLTGPVLAYGAVAVAGVRLRLAAPVVFAAVALATLLSLPAHGKYALPALWFAVLLPVPGRSRRTELVLRAAAAFLTLWLHVELAFFLCAGTAAFDLVAARGLSLRDRLGRVGALAVGGSVAVASEIVLFAALGLSPGEVSRQVLLGQAETFPGNQFSWDLWQPQYFLLLLYPTAILLPFVPAVWRPTSPATRLAVLLTVCLATIPIRRVGLPHTSAVSTLLVFQWVLIVADLQRNRGYDGDQRQQSAASGQDDGLPARHDPHVRWEAGRRTAGPVLAAGVALGALWAIGLLALGFTTHSFAPVALMVLACVATAELGRLDRHLWFSRARQPSCSPCPWPL